MGIVQIPFLELSILLTRAAPSAPSESNKPRTDSAKSLILYVAKYPFLLAGFSSTGTFLPGLPSSFPPKQVEKEEESVLCGVLNGWHSLKTLGRGS